MYLPLTFWDVSLWLAFAAIILLVTSELISPHYGITNMIIEKRKLRKAALTMGILFIATVLMRAYEIII